MELRRHARSFTGIALMGIVMPLALTAIMEDVSSSAAAIAAALVGPAAFGYSNALKDRYSGDLEFLKSLPVTADVHGASRVAALAALAVFAVLVTAPYLWAPFASLEWWGAGGFAVALTALCGVSWVLASLASATCLRFRAEKLIALFFVASFVVAFVGDRIVGPALAPYFDAERIAAIAAWVASPLGIAVCLALGILFAACMIVLSSRWMGKGVENYRREDNILKL